MKTVNAIARVLGAITFVLALTVSLVSSATDVDDPKAPKKSTLANTKWTITKIQRAGSLRNPGGDRAFTVVFNDTTISFASYCNNIKATFNEANESDIRLNKLDITQRVCSELSMSNEVEYIDILRRITKYEYDPQENVLKFYANDEIVLVLKKYESDLRYYVAPNGRRVG